MVLRAVDVGGLVVLALALAGCMRPVPAANRPIVIDVARAHGVELVTAAPDDGDGGSAWQRDQDVDVEWRGSWYPAIVLGRRGVGRFLVHYEGHGEEWDEVVAASRIRERRGSGDVDEPSPQPDANDP
jgi:hypothetical protein